MRYLIGKKASSQQQIALVVSRRYSTFSRWWCFHFHFCSFMQRASHLTVYRAAGLIVTIWHNFNLKTIFSRTEMFLQKITFCADDFVESSRKLFFFNFRALLTNTLEKRNYLWKYFCCNNLLSFLLRSPLWLFLRFQFFSHSCSSTILLFVTAHNKKSHHSMVYCAENFQLL